MSKRLKDHQGIGGFGYCVVCGQKPSSTRFNQDDCKGDWDA